MAPPPDSRTAEPQAPRSKPKRGLVQKIGGPIVLVGLAGAGVYLWNENTVSATAREALDADSRNVGLAVDVRYKYWLLSDILVFDIRKVDGKAPVDLLRALFQTAAAFRGDSFELVELRYHGDTNFMLHGVYFRQLGDEFSAGQNPIYLVRTFPQNVKRPDGTAAFETWEGGVLGVTAQQIEDANELVRQWVGP